LGSGLHSLVTSGLFREKGCLEVEPQTNATWLYSENGAETSNMLVAEIVLWFKGHPGTVLGLAAGRL
jgi:hypothetical protein